MGAFILDYTNTAVIIPCYNEAVTIGKVIDDFHRELPGATVYVYDNNSTDGTSQIALEHGATVRLEPRQGKGNVCRQMFRDIDAGCYLMVDGDDTYPAEAARALCDPILAGEADMTVGDRLSNGTYTEENKRAFHGFGNNLVRAMIKWIYGYSFEDVMTGYRAMCQPFVKTFPVLSEGFQIETELSIHAVDHRWRIKDVPVEYRDRPAGSVSKLDTVGDGIKVIAMIVTLFKDYRPLKFFSLVALLFAVIGLALGIPIIVDYYHTGLVPRFPTAILAASFMFLCGLSLATGLILDSVAKVEKKQWELQVYRARCNESE
ncbi:glycosyltransferase [Collinsella sp. OM08-14AT]|nr:glycosyltransferase [Collinsella sp. OM08-14AT]